MLKFLRILSLSLLILSLCVPSYAVTEFIITVNKTGEDYDTLALAEDALDNAGDIRDTGSVKCGSWDSCSSGTCDSANMIDGEAVTWDAGSSTGTLWHITGTQYMLTVSTGSLADDDVVDDGESNSFVVNGAPDSCQITMELYDDDGACDTSIWTVFGFTTDSDNYVKVTAPTGERHDGTMPSGAAGDGACVDANAIAIAQEHSILEWIGITTSAATSTNARCLRCQRDEVVCRNLIVADCINAGAGIYDAIATNNTANDVDFLNIIIYNAEDEGMDLFGGTGTYDISNVSIYNSGGDGILVTAATGTTTVTNGLVIDSSGSDYGANIDTITTSGSGDTTGTSGLQNLVAADEWVSLTGGSEDLHLKSGSTSEDAGTDLGTTNGVNFDIDNRDRDAQGDTWDLGADEFVAAGATRRILLIN